MSSKELTPIDVEVVPVEDLGHIKVIANIDASQENQVAIGKRGNAIFGLAPNVIDLAERKRLYKVKVPEGYTLKDLISSKKDPEAVRALVRDQKGRLNGNVSLKATAIGPAQIASIGLAAAAMVVGQAYMTEISKSLESIDTKLGLITSMITGEQKSTVTNALSIASRYLHDDPLGKPAEARQSERNEIERNYNDVGQVIDWITEQLTDLEARVQGTKAQEKNLKPLLEEFRSYEDQFSMSLKALSTLAMTRMYYDGSMDDRSARVEWQRICDKSEGFSRKWTFLAGLMEMKVGAMRRALVSFPQSTQGNPVKTLLSQSPRAAAKEKLFQAKFDMRKEIRSGSSELSSVVDECNHAIERIAAASRSARTILTDGTECWLIEDEDD